MAQFDALGWLRFARHKAVKLTSYERLALCVLISHARTVEGYGQCWPSVALVAQEMSCSIRTARAALSSLRRQRVFMARKRRTEAGQTSNLYLFPVKPPMPPALNA